MSADPMAWMRAAEEAREQGRYDDALQLHLKFHREALAIEPGLYGVRLSFALSDWLETARLHPPAMQALIAERDDGVAALLAGNGTRQLFHDARSINRTLDARADTHALLAELAERDLPFARSCADMARDEVLEAADFALAAQLFDSFEDDVRRGAETFNESVGRAGDRPIRWRTTAEVYARELRSMFGLLEGMQRHDEAERLRELALDLVEDAEFRADLRPLLAGRSVRPGLLAAEDALAQCAFEQSSADRAVAAVLLDVLLTIGDDLEDYTRPTIDACDVRRQTVHVSGRVPAPDGTSQPFAVRAVVGPRGRMMRATRVTIGDRTFAPVIDSWRLVDGEGPAAT